MLAGHNVLKWWAQFSWFWTAICSCLLLPNHTNSHPGCCKHQIQLMELWFFLLPYGKAARGKKEAALRQHLSVLAPRVQRRCGVWGTSPSWAICWREKWEMRDKLFLWHLPHPGRLCEADLARQCCCSLIRSNHQTVCVPGERGGLCSAAPGCSLPGLLFSHLPPFKSSYVFILFSSHIKGGEGEKCQQLISRLVLKFGFSTENVRICFHPFKRWNKANELAVQEVFCAWPWRDRETGSRGNIKLNTHLQGVFVL